MKFSTYLSYSSKRFHQLMKPIQSFLLLLILANLATANIVIHEIHYHDPSDDANGEFLELYNTSNTPVDLSDWAFTQGINFKIPQGTILNGQSYLVVCRNEIYLRRHYNLPESVMTVGNFAPTRLSNSGEDIRLENAFGRIIDEVSYNDRSPWPSAADGGGASLELVNPFADNSQALYWSASVAPTPGRVNSRYVQETPPHFISVSRDPQSPGNSQPVTVTVRFSPNDILQNVTLIYQSNGALGEVLEMTRQGDFNLYTATIPPQPAGALVEYAVSATNSPGFMVISPASGSTVSFYHYRVDSPEVPKGTVLIHEIMYNDPSESDEDQEWIELYNPGTQTVDLSYWVLQDSNDHHRFRLPAGTSIAPKGYLLIARARNPAWTAPTVTGLPFSLGNDGDEIRLFDPNGRLVTWMEYKDKGGWPAGADGYGRSLELVQVSRPNHEPNNWAVSVLGGTPGRANSSAIDDSAYRDFEIVINEIHYHPKDEDYGNLDKEFVELHNRGTQAVDLSGWYFSDGIEFRFPQGTVIPGKGYLLVARNVREYPEVANKVGNYTLKLSNSGESISLTSQRGIVIDYVPYKDRFPWPAMPDGRGVSLELIAPTADNSVAQVWRSGQPMSPGVENADLHPNAPPRITNVRHTPEFPQATAGESQTVKETIVQEGDSWRFFRGTSAPPASWRYAFFDDSGWEQGPSGFGYDDGDDNTVLSDMRNNYVSVFIRRTLQLPEVDNDVRIVLEVNYDDGFVAYFNGVEIARANVAGTPPSHTTTASGNHEAGEFEAFDVTALVRQNFRSGTNVLAIQGHNVNLTSSDFSLVPVLSLVKTISTGDESGETVVITAKVQDDDGIGEVKLEYQHLTSPSGTGLVLGEWASVNMYDDGTNGDAIAGDSIYSFRLSDVEAIRPNEIWRYRIWAKDLSGENATVPLQTEETRNFAFFVRNGNENHPYPTTHLFLERSVLDWLNRNVESDEEQRAIMVIDGEVFDLYHGGGVRFRGHVLRNKPKKSWKVQFAKNKRWNNQRTLNLNSNYQTSALVRGEAGFIEHVAYEVFRQIGIPTPRTHHRRMVLNNEYYGLFLQIEQYNEDFLENHNLPEETLIFKAGVKARPTFMTREPNFEAYTRKYENMIGQERDLQVLIDFIDELNRTSDTKAFFEENMNIEVYLTYLATLAILSHVDATEKNYFPTRGADGRWYVQPWDISHAWGEMFDITSYPFKHDYSLLDGAEGGKFGTNIMRQKFLRVPEFRKRYYERLRDFTSHIFTHEHLDPLFDNYWDFLKPGIDENTERWNSPGLLDRLVSEMKRYITNRRNFILQNSEVVPANLPPQPVNVSPANGGNLASRSMVLQASMDASALFVVQWEMQEGGIDFFNPTWRGETSFPSVDIPETALASNTTYYWRVRYRTSEDGAWSEWSDATSFTTSADLEAPDVQNVVVTPMDRSVQLKWDLPVASDLLRVDIYQGGQIIGSTPIVKNQVHIQDLVNGQDYVFTIRVVTVDRRESAGFMVMAMPRVTLTPGQTIAYFRFEDDPMDEGGMFVGELLGDAIIGVPGSEDPIPLTGVVNIASLQLNGAAGDGFRFGSIEPELDAQETLTIECYAQLNGTSEAPVVMVDRYDESTTSLDGIWRFGLNLSSPGSIDFFLNDADSSAGYNGRLQVSTVGDIVPRDGGFHHYAAVVDLGRRSVMEKVRLYLDGHPMRTVILHEDGVSDYDALRTSSDLPILIGAKRTANGTANVLSGRVDEVRLINAALTPDQFLHPPDASVRDWALY